MSDAGAKARRDFAEEVVVKLRRAGFQALWAGGCVRDILLGLAPADYDVATDATPEQAMAALPYRALAIGAAFGVVKVRHPRQKGNEVEIATFRSDLAYVDGRRPVGVVYSSPREDAERRDFTLNGLFMDPLSGEVIDYVGGRADLEAGVLRAIGDPTARFEEDKLRLLRAARFAARFGLAIDPATWEAVRAMAPRIIVVSPERIAQELQRMLSHPSRARAVGLLIDGGLLGAVLPPLGALDADARSRMLKTLEALPPDASFPLALAVLLRDVGADCPDPDAAGARIADGLARGLRLSNAERERVVQLVRRQRSLVEPERLRESALKRLLASPGIDELLELHRAVALATGADPGHVDYCRRYLEHQPTGLIDPPPLLTGNDLIRHGLKPGAEFARILEKVRDAQLESRIRDRDEALAFVDRELAPARVDRPEPDGSTTEERMTVPSSRTAAVLVSGGVESAVLVATMLERYPRVHPVYIRCGLRWEAVELAATRAFLAAIAREGLEPLVVLDEPIRDVYGPHWSTDGPEVPGADSPDEAVYLPGRNLLLIVKAAVWCRLRGVSALALGSLGSNPFPDSTAEFFGGLESVISRAMSGGPKLLRPFAGLHKPDVVRRGAGLPLEKTFSCIRPVDGLHCGRCNKCAERRQGFRDAGEPDPTRYAD